MDAALQRENAAGRQPDENASAQLERAMGIEPTTYSLGSCRSTTELRPRSAQHSQAGTDTEVRRPKPSGGADGLQQALYFRGQAVALP